MSQGHNPTDLRAAAEREAAAKKQAAAHEAMLDGDLAKIMAEPHGRRFVARIIGYCEVGKDPFSTNAMTMAHKCGKRSVGVLIEEDLKRVCPEQFLLMEAEVRDARVAARKKAEG